MGWPAMAGLHAGTNADGSKSGRGELVPGATVHGALRPTTPRHCLQMGKRNGNSMNMKRMRGRGHRPGGGGGGGGGGGPIRHHSPGNIPLNRNHALDSSAPEIRVRGPAQPFVEKY